VKLGNLYVAAAAQGTALIAALAHAELITDFNQVGGNVVASMSGSIDTQT
jgi:hypothetical protein